MPQTYTKRRVWIETKISVDQQHNIECYSAINIILFLFLPLNKKR